jgi:hypothetical protein
MIVLPWETIVKVRKKYTKRDTWKNIMCTNRRGLAVVSQYIIDKNLHIDRSSWFFFFFF